MADRLRALATRNLNSMDMNRIEFGIDRTDPSDEYMNAPQEPIRQMNGMLTQDIPIFSSREQAGWDAALPLMFNTQMSGRAVKALDIYTWQLLMYDKSTQIALERIRDKKNGAGASSHKRFVDRVEDYFRDVDKMAETWRPNGVLFAPPSPYGRTGPNEQDFSSIEGQVLHCPVITNGAFMMTNLFKSTRVIPINASCYMMIKMVKLQRVEPPVFRDVGTVTIVPEESREYISEDRCMVAVFTWTLGAPPEVSDPATIYKCIKEGIDPPLYSRSYLDYVRDEDGKMTVDKTTGKYLPVIRTAQMFFMGKTLFQHVNENYEDKSLAHRIEIPLLHSSLRTSGKKINVYTPPTQRIYC